MIGETRESMQKRLEDTEKDRARLQGELDAALGREQALAAHVEHLESLRVNVIEAIGNDRLDDLDISFYRDDTQPSKPSTRLAQRDLIKKAEALESLVDLWNGDQDLDEEGGTIVTIDTGWVKSRATELRQRAADIEETGR